METIEQLPQAAQGLWNILKQTKGRLPEITAEQYWMLGGGTLLAARWKGYGPPRQSEDLDIKIRAPAHEKGKQEKKKLEIAELERALRNVGGTKWVHQEGTDEGCDWSQTWSFEQKGAGKIDLVELHHSTPWVPRPGRIEDIELLLEPTASILFGKLWRSHMTLARDAFDLGVAGELDPEELTKALRVLGKTRTQQALEHIRRNQQRLEVEGQTELKGVTQMWEDMATSPGQAASRAIEQGWAVTENEQRQAMANELEPIALRIRLIQLEQGSGEVTMNVKPEALDIIWNEPREENTLVVASNISDEEWKRAWMSLRGARTEKEKLLIVRTLEQALAEERARIRVRGLSPR